MIANFPEIQKKIDKIVTAYLRQEINNKAPMLNLAGKKRYYEGEKMWTVKSDWTLSISEFQKVESSFSISDDEMKTIDATHLLNKVSGVAEDMANKMERGMFDLIHEVTTETWNVIEAKKEDFPSSLLLMIEKIYIDFINDNRDTPSMPTIFAGPEMITQMKESFDKMTPEEKSKYDAKHKLVMDKKYEQFLSDLNCRKLTD